MLTASVFLMLVSKICDAAIFSDVHWTTAITLSEYVSYKSMSILSYDIPDQTEIVQFSFTVKTAGDACQFREVQVYFQHGSYPLVTPYNETYPDYFYLNRTDAYHVALKKDTDFVTFELLAPRPGTWYFASFLPKATSDKIEQKGFGSSDKKCMYGMFIVVEAQGVDNVPELAVEQHRTVHLHQDPVDYQVMYRYRLPYDTVQYEVVINNCQASLLVDTPDVSEDHPSYNISEDSSSSSNETVTVQHISLLKDVNGSSKFVGSRSNSTPSTVPSSATSLMSSTNTTEPPAPTSAPAVVTSSQCPVTVTISSEKLPAPGVKDRYNCSNSTNCQHTILSPTIGKWTYLSIILDDSLNVSEVTFKLRFHIKSCESMKFMLPRTIFDAQQLQPRSSSSQLTTIPQDSCLLMDSLGRLKKSDDAFNVSFLLVGSGPLPVPLTLYDVRVLRSHVMVTSFDIQDHADIGGTFRLQSKFNGDQHIMNNHHQYIVVYICLMKNALPGGSTVKPCERGIGLLLNSSLSATTEVYIPYPEAGTWFLGITGHCISTKNGLAEQCAIEPLINLDLGMSGCVDGQCGKYGICGNFISGVHVFSSCRCFAGWRGYGCTDSTEGRSRNEELEAVLLLTLSNLFFLPAIVLSIYRAFYVEALIYLYTMFFSTFYHACDTSDIVYYCMVKYDILSFADFYGSISSFWMTMLAMSDLRPGVRSFTHMLGVMGVAVGVEYDRHGLWVFVVPAGLAALIMFFTWILQCRKRRSLFPPKKFYLFHFLPGILLALTGLVLFAFFETTENYKYTHSAWHMAMALSIVFLLPVRSRKVTTEQVSSMETFETLDASTDSHDSLGNQSEMSGNQRGASVNSLCTGEPRKKKWREKLRNLL